MPINETEWNRKRKKLREIRRERQREKWKREINRKSKWGEREREREREYKLRCNYFLKLNFWILLLQIISLFQFF